MKKAGFLASILAAAVLVGCGGSEPEVAEQLRPVRYVVIEDGTTLRDRSFSGTSKSTTESRLSFRVTGTVEDIPVQIGQRLDAGSPIMELDPTTYELQVQQAEAALVEAEANDRRSATNYERTRGLYANDNASLNDLEAARAQAESAEAMVDSAAKALEIARLNLSYTRLTADTDCSIASLDVEVNENVSAGQQVAMVSCGDAFEVTLDLPESVIANVSVGVEVSIGFGAIEDAEFTGIVTEVAVAASQAAAGFPIVVQVNERHPSLRSGLAADVTFQFGNNQAGYAPVVPVDAIVNDPGGTYVFVAEPAETAGEGVVRRRDVDLGELTQLGVEITEGLFVGDRVVTAGVSVIRDGQRVLIPETG
ncbi:MAG: efflux RND transporter periplasmic adaptor subunit [Woeseiaceae bacterium]|nr:efflux RND transporter periplasmic adaptor subunit [Woeseiaceae bacterium]